MNSVIAHAAVAPVFREASLRTEQVTQLVMGETADLLETTGTWYRIRTAVDHYEGWVHRGYIRDVTAEEAVRWREEATGWSTGAEIETTAGRRRVPVRARAVLEHGRIRLPDGTSGSLTQGHMLPADELRRLARTVPAEQWALETFSGAPYQWGGLTECGVDCSGLVQTTFAARGVPLPRDSSAQALVGAEVARDAIAPGDLLFFSENGRSVTHVAFAAEDDTLVHSTVSCGGVLRESWAPGHRAAHLRELFVTARRVPGAAASE
ncbi:MAG: C40 family peptidase [Gemmatimonadales bacterium]